MKERRHYIRWQINTNAKLRLEGALADMACIIHDLSFNGARISLAPKLPQDRPLETKLSLAEGFNFETEIWIVWHKRVMDTNVYGVYFSRIKDSDKKTIYKFMYQSFRDVLKISEWQIPLEIKGGEEEMKQNGFNLDADRRIFERIPVSLPVKLLDLDTDKELEADTCDLSAKGLRIVSSGYLKPGHRLELWINMPDKKREPFYTKGSVVWAKEQEAGKYKTGISLEKAEFMGLSGAFKS